MLRTFIRRAGAVTVGSTATGITAATVYANTDAGAGFRREFIFWSKVFPVVADYYLQTARSSPYVKFQKLTSTGLYECEDEGVKSIDDDNDNETSDRIVNVEKSLESSYKRKRKIVIDGLHEKHAPGIFGVMLELKGLYIKLGQVLSVTALPVPDAYRTLFRTLQSNVPGHEDFESVVKPTLEKEFGQPLENLFEFVESDVLGAASIGQAHRARLKKTNLNDNSINEEEERDVVIKVQYPDAKWQVPADIHCVGDFLNICVWFGAVDKDSAKMSYEEFARQFISELDYDRERQNLQTVYASSLDRNAPYIKNGVLIPKVYQDLCTGTVITMTYFPGPTLESEAKRQLELLGIDTSGGIAKVIKDAANDAVENPDDASSGEILRRVTKRLGHNHGHGMSTNTSTSNNSKIQKPTQPSWKVSASKIIGNFVGFDSVLWAVRAAKRFLLLSQAVAVNTIHWTPKFLVSSKVDQWAKDHQSAASQAQRLGEIEQWCKALFDVHGHQIFQLGLFNADPHPGNLIVTGGSGSEGERRDGKKRKATEKKLKIGLIDYGQCKELTLEEQYKVARLLLSVSNNEPDSIVADAFREMNVGTKNDSTEFLATFARLMFGPFEAKHLDHAWHMSLHKMDKVTYFPRELSMVYRTSLLLRGLAISLQMNFSICDEWQHHAEAAVEKFERERKDSIQVRT